MDACGARASQGGGGRIGRVLAWLARHVAGVWRALWQLWQAWWHGRARPAAPPALHRVTHTKRVTGLNLVANQFAAAKDAAAGDELSCTGDVWDDDEWDREVMPVPRGQRTALSPQHCDAPVPGRVGAELGGPIAQSRWSSMRIRKHCTLQTSLRVKPGRTTYVGAMALGTTLSTVKKSPFSFIPFVRDLFTRTEQMLVKSAILVFITARLQPRATQAPSFRATTA